MDDATLQLETDLHDVRSRERAIAALLNFPAILYLRDLRRMIDENPACLTSMDQSIRRKIQGFLSNQGIFWDEAVLEKQLVDIVVQAVGLLKGLNNNCPRSGWAGGTTRTRMVRR